MMNERAREMPDMTPAQRRTNWWHYHWRYVAVAVIAVVLLTATLWERVSKIRADVSVAVVTKYALTAHDVETIQAALEAVAEDTNGDGKVSVAINPIQIDYASTSMDDAAVQVMTTNVDKLNADFYTYQSGVFLLDDPASFVSQHHALEYLDGTEPPEDAIDWENMTIAWRDCLGDADLDQCDTAALWFGRRIGMENDAGTAALWNALHLN